MTQIKKNKPIIINPAILETLDEAFLAKSRIALPLEWLINQTFSMASVEFLAQIPDNSIDLFFTDEPYGIESSIIYLHREGRAITTHFDWDSNLPAHLTMPWLHEAQRVLKPGGALLCFGIASWNTTFENMCVHVGLDFRAHNVWLKTNAPMRIRRGGKRSAHEMLWLASKGTLRHRQKRVSQFELLNWYMETQCPSCQTQFPVVMGNADTLDTLDWNRTYVGPYKAHAERIGHETEKPDWILYSNIHEFSDEGDVVVDCFSGSGAIPHVAARMGRNFIANDINPRWAETLENRIQILPTSIF